MSILQINDFDFSALSFGSEVKTGSNNGNKYVQLGYGPEKEQVKVRLAKTVNDAFRAPFGKDPVSKNEPDKFCVKIEMTPDVRAFIETFETATINAALANSMAWMKVKKTDFATLKATYSSPIKASSKEDEADTLKLKLKTNGSSKDTKVEVGSLKNGKLTNVKPGTVDDIEKGDKILPIVLVQGGVWLGANKAFGTRPRGRAAPRPRASRVSASCGLRAGRLRVSTVLGLA